MNRVGELHKYAIQTTSGWFDISTPRVEDVRLEDIAASLAKLCRFTGHSREPYSVAQHSVHVAELVPDFAKLAGLFHDAQEAYIGDISRPMKWLLEDLSPGTVKRIEANVACVISQKFGIENSHQRLIKWADNVMLATEKRDLFDSQVPWKGLPSPAPWMVVPWPAEVAEQRFLEAYHGLTKGKVYESDV